MGCCTEKRCGGRVLVKTIAVGESGIYGIGSGGTARARVGIPSVLLHVTLHAFARNQSGGTRVYDSTEKWQITPVAIQNGDQPLSPVFVNNSDVATTRAMPDSYEVETGIKAANVSMVIAPTGVKGTYYLQAIFEPACPGISQPDLEELFAFCELNLLGAFVHTQ